MADSASADSAGSALVGIRLGGGASGAEKSGEGGTGPLGTILALAEGPEPVGEPSVASAAFWLPAGLASLFLMRSCSLLLSSDVDASSSSGGLIISGVVSPGGARSSISLRESKKSDMQGVVLSGTPFTLAGCGGSASPKRQFRDKASQLMMV